MVGRILRALFYHYIKQRAKQTLKRRDNSSFTTSSQKDLTTERQDTTIATSSTGISEKIIMNQLQLKRMCQLRVDSIIDRMHDLCAEGRSDDAKALYEEIQDWVVNNTELEVMSLDYINGMFEDNK